MLFLDVFAQEISFQEVSLRLANVLYEFFQFESSKNEKKE